MGKESELDPRLHGTETAPMKIDESCFFGKHKYDRGQLLEGNRCGAASSTSQCLYDEVEENNDAVG